MADSPIDVALLVIGAFEALGVPYMIGGSVASRQRISRRLTALPQAVE